MHGDSLGHNHPSLRGTKISIPYCRRSCRRFSPTRFICRAPPALGPHAIWAADKRYSLGFNTKLRMKDISMGDDAKSQAETIAKAEYLKGFELKKEFINGFRSWVDSEKQFVFLIIAFNLAISSLVLSEKVFASEKSLWIGVAVLLFLGSAGLYYWYYHTLHMAVREVLFTLEALDVEKAKQAQSEPWNRCKYAANIGAAFTLIGLLLLVWRYFHGACH